MPQLSVHPGYSDRIAYESSGLATVLDLLTYHVCDSDELGYRLAAAHEIMDMLRDMKPETYASASPEAQTIIRRARLHAETLLRIHERAKTDCLL